jgi:hypothetical protein
MGTPAFRVLQDFNVGVGRGSFQYRVGEVIRLGGPAGLTLKQIEGAVSMEWVEPIPARRRRCYEPPPVDNSLLDPALEALLHRIEDEGLQDELRRVIRRRINK